MSPEAGLVVENLSVSYAISRGPFRRADELPALRDVDLTIAPGRTLGVVGESGCGKSTLARAILRLQSLKGGVVRWNGEAISALSEPAFRRVRPQMQMVFQDPVASLNPRMRVLDIIAEPLATHRPELSGAQRRQKVLEAMERVGLRPEMADRFPHEFSGGQAQRIGIARAIVLEPGLLICDEAVSALDVSIRAQVLVLLEKLQREMGLSILFISHDLSVVRQIAHDILVLYLGRVVEQAPRDVLFATPRHPYTQALIGSVLSADPRIEKAHQSPPIGGDLPSPIDPPPGCPFHTRCPLAEPICAQAMPGLETWPDGGRVACHVANRERPAAA
ncbi:oligopeptide transport system ATP-binding protein [Devosia enhydra]|uniref:Oligopeptide transport system ATP-binding protein n=1 Tax=Devosia enhydra TaxID=665118 RepID=A0A1K2HZF6_9HYPH|nr:oligopeptide/dipeptide ABC transporter ATP-binding protein [Devosia enhydra]SFZ85525.1 oligopeptide transport system ATP-binding protein [Devosia enhydra]